MSLFEPQVVSRLRENLAQVRDRIATAAARSGRDADQIMLVGVTKYVEPEFARLFALAGLTELGESRPQELWRKAELLADLPVHWHLIGHLQRNKVRRTLPLVALLHGVDSLRLIEEISREQAPHRVRANALLEVNVSGDATKHGLKPDEVEPLLAQIGNLPGLSVLGLMTIAAQGGGPVRARRDFAALRELADRLRPLCPANVVMKQLSMGMSGDYEIAIEEGATIVRVGSTLLEGLER